MRRLVVNMATRHSFDGFLYRVRVKEYGSGCPSCSRRKKKEILTSTSIHGACLECGFQKFPSKTRFSRGR